MPLDRSRVARFLVAAAAALLVAHLADGWAYSSLTFPDFANSDLGRMFRVQGFLPLWMVAALLLVLHDWPHRVQGGLYAAVGRGLLVFSGATIGGIVAEVLKILLRRERPLAHDGAYVFRPWTEDPLYTGSLALPSSHVLVAAGACFVLARLFPRTRYVWYALVAGCGFSRVAARAHFVSDVLLASIVGIVIAEILWRWHSRRTLASRIGQSPSLAVSGGLAEAQDD